MKIGRLLLVLLSLSARSFVGWGEHCGCKAGSNACSMPCSACCSPSTCTVTVDPTGKAQRCACARGGRP